MIYFASDTHLGLRMDGVDPLQKERQFVDWLSGLNDCTELYLMGDIFDYWFEYKHVIPKGYVRLFGQLASMTDRGVRIHFFAGNHDLWHRNYLHDELGIDVYTENRIVDICGKRILISHGDALAGPDSIIGVIFRSRFLRWIFERVVHPDLSLRFGLWWSHHNRISRSVYHKFAGENEKLVKAARKVLSHNTDLDYIMCGHIHIPLRYALNERTSLVVLGQWVLDTPVFAKMDENGTLELVEYHSLS